MQVVFVAPFGWQPKGTVRVRAFPLAQALVERGHNVTMLIPPWDDPAAAGQKWLINGVHVVNLELPPAPLPLQLTGLTRTMLRAIAHIRPEVVHVFKPIGVSGAVAQAIALARRLPGAGGPSRLVLDTDDWEGPGGWDSLADYPASVRVLFAWQEPAALRSVDAVTVASRALERLVASYVGVEPTRVHYLPNSASDRVQDVDDAAVASVRHRLGLGERPAALLSTRFFELDPAIVAAVWAHVVAQVPAARLVVVGDALHGGEAEFREELLGAGVLDTVLFTGWVQPDELGALYRAADCAFVPARDTLINRARCSVKLAELVAAGLPIVAERVGQASEYVLQGRTGFTAQPGDVLRLAAAIILLLGNAALRRALGARGRRLMRERFAWTHLVDAALAAYDPSGARPVS